MADDKHGSSDSEMAEIKERLREASRLLQEHIADSKARAEAREKENEKRHKAAEKQRAKDRAEEKARAEEFKQRQEAAEKRQEERSQRIDAQIEELGRQIGGANNRWGRIVEELVAGDLSAIIDAHLDGQAHILSTRVRPKDRSWEIDVLATNGDIAVPAEVKTTLTIDDIDKFISRILMRFTTLLPQHQGKRIYGVIAFVKVDGNESETIAHALKQGLIVVKAMHGTNKVLTDKDFKPRNYCPRQL